jgi:hypothetical protein
MFADHGRSPGAADREQRPPPSRPGIFITAQGRGGSAPRSEISFNLTKPALEDIGAIILGGLKVAGMMKP